LKRLKYGIIPQFLKYRENFFRALQMAVIQFSFEIFQHSKAARTDVWRVGWMGSSENFQATQFINNSMRIVAHRVIRVQRKLIAIFWPETRFLSFSNDGSMF
jgi:aspartate aminotransferase-like enzyme